MKFPVLFCLLLWPAASQAQAPAPQGLPEIAPLHAAPAGSPVNKPKPVATPKWATAEAPPLLGVDALSGDAVKKALSALQSDYVSPITGEQMNRATLRGLLDSLSPSIILSGSAEKAAEVPHSIAKPTKTAWAISASAIFLKTPRRRR